ncbi:MAG: hypothetical protein FWF97_04785 [Alphaproteobacteria bacterium]|nr:hypothetical protein [Alphaproteobacteria bacterium]
MNTNTILHLLENSGFRVLRADGAFIWMEDPTCFIRSLEGFVDVAWLVVTVIAGFLLLGWAVSIIRGAKGELVGIANNIRNLFLIFAILAAARPIVNTIWGGDVFGMGCKVIQVPIAEVNKIIATSKLTLKTQNEIEDELAADESTPGILGEINTAAPSSPISGSGIVSTGTGPGASGRAVSASGNFGNARSQGSSEVIYTFADGSRIKKIGGNGRAWRNNNPGNTTCPPLQFGAIACNGGFSVFPDEQTGQSAIILKLKSSKYQNAQHRQCPDMPTGSLGAAICVWAPPTDSNNTGSYQRSVSERTGIPAHAQMSTLTDQQLASVAQVIRQKEGWNPGRIERL